jgi:hypothetical protein
MDQVRKQLSGIKDWKTLHDDFMSIVPPVAQMFTPFARWNRPEPTSQIEWIIDGGPDPLKARFIAIAKLAGKRLVDGADRFNTKHPELRHIPQPVDRWLTALLYSGIVPKTAAEKMFPNLPSDSSGVIERVIELSVVLCDEIVAEEL